MIDELRTVWASVTAWFISMSAGFRLPLSGVADSDQLDSNAEPAVDPDFPGWLHNNPMVTGNPASRYGDDAPGYMTGNGLGSLEIGAADD